MAETSMLSLALSELQFVMRCKIAGITEGPLAAQCQHCAELILKAVIEDTFGVEAPKTHILRDLYTELYNRDSRAQVLYDSVRILDDYYFKTRYPGRGSYVATNVDGELASDSVHSLYTRVTALYPKLGT